MVDPAVRYITPSTTMGVACRLSRADGGPVTLPSRSVSVSNVHACSSRETFDRLICVSGEKRCAPGSRANIGQS
jgi:hypothetical protein